MSDDFGFVPQTEGYEEEEVRPEPRHAEEETVEPHWSVGLAQDSPPVPSLNLTPPAEEPAKYGDEVPVLAETEEN